MGTRNEPSYVDRGAEQVMRHPFYHREATLRGFLMHGDRQRLQAICDRYLNRPSGWAVDFRPLSSAVMLTFATIPHIRSLDARDQRYGFASEIDVAFWFPMVWDRGGKPHLSWFIPYIVVDNPYAAAAGREVYGFPKTIGTFGIPSTLASAEPYTVDAMALARYSPETRAVSQRLFEVARREAGPVSGASSIDGLRSLFPLMFGDGEGPGGRLAVGRAALENWFFRREVPVTFLRQLRDIEDPARAAFQEIVEAPARVAGLARGGFIPGKFEFRAPPLASHPIAADLGLRGDGHEVKAAFWLTFDFVMDKGTTLWRADAAGAPSASAGARGSERTAPPRAKKKVAILGGGISGLTAALELTSRPGWQDELEVSVYQKGWRLGGKGASGRNADAADRIEEHGLHVWFGFYENAFRSIRAVYDELDRDPGAPLATWDRAFAPHGSIVLTEQIDGEWRPWPLEFPPNAAVPGDGGPSMRAGDFLQPLLAGIRSLTKRLAERRGTDAAQLSLSTLAQASERVLRLAVTGVARALPLGELLPAHLLTEARAQLRALLGPRAQPSDEQRRVAISLDLALTTLGGVIADRVVTEGFEAIDDLDLVEWLRKHGAAEETLRSAPIRVVYDLTLAYRGGDLARPDIAAGTALQGLFRMLFSYKGAFMWKMQAGMGDAVFAPIYEVLRRRGVSVHFFHRVKHLDLSRDQSAVEAIRIGRQATLAGGREYAPLVDVAGLPCWPDRPRWEQLVEGEELQRRGVDLESSWSEWQDASEVTLRRGQDFDQIVLAIPIGALPPICDEIIRSRPAWQKMIERVETTPTMAYQAWTKASAEAMGWSGTREAPILSAWAEPLATWADMTHVAARESWPAAARPGHVAYFCGPLDERAATGTRFPEEERSRVAAVARTLVDEHLPKLWPGFQASQIVGEYVRANVEPSDRYVLSVKGSTRYRLKTDESGLDNVLLAGDWIDNGFNSGCIEAAVISGMQCARALAGSPREIYGETPRSAAAARPEAQSLRIDHYEVLSPCPSCRIDGAMVEHFEARQNRPLDAACRFCGRRVEGDVVVDEGHGFVDRASALGALRAWAGSEGVSHDGDGEAGDGGGAFERSIRQSFRGRSPGEVAELLFRREAVPTSFDAVSWLLARRAPAVAGADEARWTPSERERRAALADANDPALIAARALIATMLADGVLRPAEQALIERFLDHAGYPPLRTTDLRPWLPGDLGRPDDPAPIIEAMVAVAWADRERHDDEWRVIQRFADAWGYPPEQLERLDAQLGREYAPVIRRAWLSLRALLVRD